MLRHGSLLSLVMCLSAVQGTPLLDGPDGDSSPPASHCGRIVKGCDALFDASVSGIAVDVIRDPSGQTHSSNPCDDPCPDLTVDAARMVNNLHFVTETFASGDCNVAEGSAQAGTRKLLRFPAKIPNVGEMDFYLGNPTDAPDTFEWGTCHGHWHVTNFSSYRLWNVSAYNEWRQIRDTDPDSPSQDLLDANPSLSAGLVAGHKQGFCLIDVERAYVVLPIAPTHFPYCSNQGISPGWADLYGSGLDGQFIDITGVTAGVYVLEIEANPGRAFLESGYANNDVALLVPIT